MSSTILYKAGIPTLGCYYGKAFRFQKVSAGQGRSCYRGMVEICEDQFEIYHDAGGMIVAFKNEKVDQKWYNPKKVGLCDFDDFMKMDYMSGDVSQAKLQ
jgi:hypothetical protein